MTVQVWTVFKIIVKYVSDDLDRNWTSRSLLLHKTTIEMACPSSRNKHYIPHGQSKGKQSSSFFKKDWIESDGMDAHDNVYQVQELGEVFGKIRVVHIYLFNQNKIFPPESSECRAVMSLRRLQLQ